MGQGLSCRAGNHEHGLFTAVHHGHLLTVTSLLDHDPSLLHHTTVYDRHSPLHIAAAKGHIHILSNLLDRSLNPDLLNRQKQTPLMLAAMHGKIDCVQKLLQAGANVLMFDSIYGRTCLHYSAYYGHSSCLKAILSAAQSSPVAASWGFSRFVNIRDGKGATPLHLAARQRRPDCVRVLLDSGALVCASTGGYGCPGSTPLHVAARGGSLDCIRELLAWGADRLQRDASGRIPYVVAMKHKHGACASLLNPSSAEPLVWPSPLKFISELNQEAKALLEQALKDANREREKNILLKPTTYSLPSPSHSDDDNISQVSESALCCICFEQECTIEVQNCGHQMCAQCTLALCCHNKPNPATAALTPPVCPFCRSAIARLVAVKVEAQEEVDQDTNNGSKLSKSSRKTRNTNEGGSSSFKGLSFAKLGSRSSGRIAADDEWIHKD
ncbi:putative E3 ubiquitin-protein ligase XBAT31 [Arachis ipaensis]|uniref:putative E3 ubiquitin-protein ligase XBAT31 n=1 Tax=Arachis ipaensis TaxID=130454 RepID=UPI0007AEFBDF|nr:putative E3 ubiquitin-protein ligase XBAT31 [Arachis ipaensis]XP_025669191.1 putative E3 ubiquitin-protein ligase XBAT31 [Arachis hypogaea]QHN95011.1 Putative E3 ubiquitin-protein ligase [Arachis hypogaea]